MQLLKRIFGFFWALWGAIWFMIVVIIFTLIYAVVFAIYGRKVSMKCVWINCHYLCPFLLNVCLVKLRVIGQEKISPKQTYVFVANHSTQVDILATAAAMPQPIRFLAKSEIKYIPVFNYMTKMLAIMVDRKSKESREKSMKYMLAELEKGNSIFLYPEGTRNRTDQPLKEFKDGAFRLAIMGQVPIVVQTIVNAKSVNDPEGIQLLPGHIEVYFSDPIETKGMTMDNEPALKEMVRQELLKKLS